VRRSSSFASPISSISNFPSTRSWRKQTRARRLYANRIQFVRIACGAFLIYWTSRARHFEFAFRAIRFLESKFIFSINVHRTRTDVCLRNARKKRRINTVRIIPFVSAQINSSMNPQKVWFARHETLITCTHAALVIN